MKFGPARRAAPHTTPQRHDQTAAHEHRGERLALGAGGSRPAAPEDHSQGAEEDQREPEPGSAERLRDVGVGVDEQRVLGQAEASRVLEEHLDGVHHPGTEVHAGDQQALQLAVQSAVGKGQQHVVQQRPLPGDEEEADCEDPGSVETRRPARQALKPTAVISAPKRFSGAATRRRCRCR